jgi:hypothetical protein
MLVTPISYLQVLSVFSFSDRFNRKHFNSRLVDLKELCEVDLCLKDNTFVPMSWLKYPVLFRMIETLADRWGRNHSTMCTRSA